METLLGGPEAHQTADAVTRRVVIDVKRNFGAVADEAFLEQCAREAVNELWRDPIKVTSFVPVLAMRRVREIIDSKGTITIEPASKA